MCKTVVRSALPFFLLFLAWHTCHCNTEHHGVTPFFCGANVHVYKLAHMHAHTLSLFHVLSLPCTHTQLHTYTCSHILFCSVSSLSLLHTHTYRYILKKVFNHNDLGAVTMMFKMYSYSFVWDSISPHTNDCSSRHMQNNKQH